ncbi:MAG: hypothetical protein N3F03_07975 [Ignavibacteria bacterium]|nr:hypothetical protein [Ignavibacteria bacterium]
MFKTFYEKIVLSLILVLLLFNHSLSQDKNLSNTNLIYLRVEISTTSDWTIFKWTILPKIVTMRVFAVDGPNPKYQVFYDQIKLTQKISKENSRVRIFVDYLINVKTYEKWSFTLSKGQIGETKVNVSVKDDLNFQEIFSLNHNKVIQKDPEENKINSTIEFNFKPEYKFIPDSISTTKIPKLLLAFYYLWYSKNNWNDLPLVDKPLKLYSSADEKEMLRQINLAKQNGIDGFITSWDGPGTYSDNNFKKFLELCNKNNFKTSIYYETLTSDGPRNVEEIYSSLKFAIQKYGNDKAFIKIFDKPLIFIWASNEMEINKWREILTRLRTNNIEGTFIAMGYDISNLQIFDGLHQYGVILIDSLEKEFQVLSEIVKNYHLIGGKQKIWTATVQPGYDERKLPKRIGLFKDRQKGKFYEFTWNAAIKSNPDLILITSFNEWWENTHIEPSVNYKNYYMNLTKKYSRLWKRK